MVKISLEVWENFENVAVKTIEFIKDLKDKNNQLQKENEELKQQIDDLETDLRDWKCAYDGFRD